MEDIYLNPALNMLTTLQVFERIIFLSTKSPKGKIEKVYSLDKGISEYVLVEQEDLVC